MVVVIVVVFITTYFYVIKIFIIYFFTIIIVLIILDLKDIIYTAVLWTDKSNIHCILKLFFHKCKKNHWPSLGWMFSISGLDRIASKTCWMYFSWMLLFTYCTQKHNIWCTCVNNLHSLLLDTFPSAYLVNWASWQAITIIINKNKQQNKPPHFKMYSNTQATTRL